VGTFSYDADNRETGETWGGASPRTLTFTYDNVGNMLTAANNNGAYTMSYDALGRVTVVNDMWGDTLTFS
jgi:YD repeat-containing protein